MGHERTVSIRELFWFIIGKINLVLYMMLAGIVLFGGYLIAVSFDFSFPQIEEEETIEVLKDELDSEELSYLQNVLDMYDQGLVMRDSYQNDYVMNMNPFDISRMNGQIYISTGYTYNLYENIDSDYTSALIQGYKTLLNSDVVRTKLLELGIEGLRENDLKTIISITDTDTILNIVVRADDDDTSEMIYRVLEDTLYDYYDTFVEVFGKHKVIKLFETYAHIGDAAITNAQNDMKNELLSYESKLKTYVDELNETQRKIYDLHVENRNEEGAEDDIVEKENSQYTKFFQILVKAVICAIAAAIIGVMFLVVNYFFSDRVRNVYDLTSVLDNEIVWKSIYSGENIKRFLGKIGQKRCFAVEGTVELVASYCERRSVDTLVITGSSDICVSEDVKVVMDKNFGKRNISVIYMDNIFDEVNTEILSNACVLVVEYADKSNCSSIIALKKYLDSFDSKIIGSVLMI